MSKEHRIFNLPNGKQTHNERIFKSGWRGLIKRVSTPLKLGIGDINQHSCNLVTFFKKSNGKKVVDKNFNIPYWLLIKILNALYRKDKEIYNLKKNLNKYNKALKESRKNEEILAAELAKKSDVSAHAILTF